MTVCQSIVGGLLSLFCGATAILPANAQVVDTPVATSRTSSSSASGSSTDDFSTNGNTGQPAEGPTSTLSDPTVLSVVPPSRAGLLASPRIVPLRDAGASDPGRLAAAPVRLGGIGAPLGFVTQPVIEPGRNYSVVPSLEVQLLGTDNVFQSNANRRADLVTSVSPGLFVAADTLRLQGSLNYAPTAQFYARNTGQNRVDQRLDGAALAAIVPGRLYVDLRGFSGTQSVTGGFTPQGNAVMDQRNQVQSTYLQVTPYVLQQFGGLVTAQLGYSFTYSSQDGTRAFLPGGTQPYFTPQSFTSHEGFAVVRSGEKLGRLVVEGRLGGTSYSGTGSLNGAYRAAATVEALYGLSRTIAVLAEIGYEDQSYGGSPPLRISDVVYAIGGRLTPSDSTTITLKYGHRDGFDSAELDATVRLGSRTRLNAAYVDRLSTATRRNQDLLSATSIDALGYLVAGGFAGPSLSGGSLLAQQNSLLRIRHASGALTYTLPRDTVTLSVFYEEQTPVSITPGTVAFAQRGYSGSLTWAHELTPRTTVFSLAQYGVFNSPTLGAGDVTTGSVSLVHQLTPNLSGSMQYAITRRGADVTTNRSVQNIALISLRRTF